MRGTQLNPRGRALAYQNYIYSTYIIQIVQIAASGNDGVSWLTSAIQRAETAIQPFSQVIQPGLTATALLFSSLGSTHHYTPLILMLESAGVIELAGAFIFLLQYYNILLKSVDGVTNLFTFKMICSDHQV